MKKKLGLIASIIICILLLSATIGWACKVEPEVTAQQIPSTVTKTVTIPPEITPTIVNQGEQVAVFDVYINIEGTSEVKDLKFYDTASGSQTTSASFFLQAGDIVSGLPIICQNEGNVPVDIVISYEESGDYGYINVAPDTYLGLQPQSSFEFVITVGINSNQTQNKLVIVSLVFKDTT